MFEGYISKKLLRECYATLVMNFGCILTGLTLSLPACLIPQLKTEGHYVSTLTESLLGSVSIMVFGITTFISTFIIGRTSRKKIIRISLATYAVGTIILLFSSNPVPLGIGLAIQALFVSNFFPITMSYVSEICQKERRGILVSSGYVCGTIGLSMNYILNSISWRVIAVLMLIICLSEFLQTYLIPESNYWYLLNGKYDKAKESILWFEPGLTDEELNQRIENILQANEEFKTESKGQFAEVIGSLRHKKFYKPLLLGMLINVFRSGDGRLVIGIYIETIIKDIDTPYETSTLIKLFGWADIIGSFIILLFIHKIKRKTLIFGSSMTLVVSLGFVVAYKFSQQLGHSLPHWLPVGSLYVFAMCVVTAYHSVISIIVSEIQVPSVRPQMNSLQNGIGLIFYCFYTFIFPHVEKIIPIQYLFMYSMFNITMTMFVILILVPETSKLEFYENDVKSPELSGDKNKIDDTKT